MVKVSLVTDKTTWENFVLNSTQASFLQSFNWGEFNQKLKLKIFRLGFYHNSHLKGLALIIKKQAKRGTYLECPAGPIIPWQDEKYLAAFIKKTKQLAKLEKASFIRIRPNVLESKENLKALKFHHFIQAPMHLHAETTWVLDLKFSSEKLLQNMRKNTRYAIRKAEKIGVKVESSVLKSDINLLYKLQLEAVKRHRFVPFSKNYFLKQLESFKSDNQIQLFKASYKGEILAISFIIFYGNEAVYHYSGSSNKLRHIPASYLLQWRAILEAKNRGLARYNFWGIAKSDNPKHRFAGVSLFKKGFGGERLDYLRTHDLPVNPSYYLTYLFETLRKKSRHL